jgi:predicted kinase
MIQQGFWFDENGTMVKSKVYIVWGSPASGKTTYVKMNMEAGDLVVDLDLIKQSISMTSKTEAQDNLLDVAIGIREYLYDRIERRQFTCKNVWVIASLPLGNRRTELAKRLRAELVHCEATEEECISRAMNDGERLDKEKQIMIIKKWFKNFYNE